MPNEEATTSLGIDTYLRILRRQWRIVAAAAVAGVVIAGACLLLIPSTVTATAQVNLSVITTDPFDPQGPASSLLDDATESAIAGSYVVAERATRILDDGTSADALHDEIEVTISENGTIARISTTASSTEQAITRTDAVTSAYLSYRSDEAERRRDSIVSDLTDRIDGLRSDLAEANQRLADADGGSEQAQAGSDREQILTELGGMLSERTSLQTIDTAGGSVLTSASEAEMVVAPSKKIIAATGVGGGLFLGIVLAFVREPFDRRLRTAAEITRATGTRLIARIENDDHLDAHSETIRVARERVLSDIAPDASVLAVIDDTDTHIATTLNDAIATSGRSVTHMDLGTTPAQHASEEAQTAPPGHLVVLSHETSSGTADLLSMLRIADAVVLVAREREADRSALAALVDEIRHADLDLLGTIVLPATGHEPRTAPHRADVAHDVGAAVVDRELDRVP